MKISSDVKQRLLQSNGFSPEEFRVEVLPDHSLYRNLTQPILGKIARAIESCFKEKTPFAISLYAELSKCKSSIVVVKRDKWHERMRKAVRFLPYAGMGAGLILGLLSRDSFLAVSKTSCKNGFSAHPLLHSINTFKRWEVNNIAYLTPFFIPAFFHWKEHFNRIEWGFFKERVVKLFTIDRAKIDSEIVSGKFCFKGIEALTKTFINRIVSTGSLVALGLGNPIYMGLSHLFFRDFNLSGSILMKTVSATLLSQEFSVLSNAVSKKGQAAMLGYATLYALTDALFLYNTASQCHTVLEVICGLAVGIGLVKLSRHLENKTNLGNPLRN